jgi:hypothetical protein
LGLIDLVLLMISGGFCLAFAGDQLGMPPESFETRLQPLIAFALVMLMAMIAVGVYGADALRSVRFASARLLVAVSLG